jgi:hypothetical protein
LERHPKSVTSEQCYFLRTNLWFLVKFLSFISMTSHFLLLLKISILGFSADILWKFQIIIFLKLYTYYSNVKSDFFFILTGKTWRHVSYCLSQKHFKNSYKNHRIFTKCCNRAHFSWNFLHFFCTITNSTRQKCFIVENANYK